ncbi:MAG TPA: sodium-transporting two-sector ATPase [Candidatus Saccharimonadales bacterium]|nr:sodium-transporting two-sector ATPase [Candidatus Saccharimonadales bacterium]
MSDQSHFDAFIKKGNPVGEVISVDKSLVKASGLQPCALNSLVMFEDGSKGFVFQVQPDHVVVLHLGAVPVRVGMVVVIQHETLVCKVGKGFIGRVVNVSGDPLDGKGPIQADDVWPVFNEAPKLYERRLVEDQVESGVSAIDALYPIVKGQRMALLGEGKSGKSTIATQFMINQMNTDQVGIYCLIAKRRSDIDTVLSRIAEAGATDKVTVVIATAFESLINNYLAPYVSCAIAEYLWQKCDQDSVIIYDDLTSHAQAYREISLLSGVSPGRDSYPGDAFYAHSSLLERAGRLDRTGKSLTSIPMVHVPNGDITAYLPTNIMSITDGQWVLDMKTFKSGIRPAINIGLSVTRAGGVGHNKRQKEYASRTLKLLASYRQAQEYAQFGAELSVEAQHTLVIGKLIYEILTQGPTDTYNLMAQQLLFSIVLDLKDTEKISINDLKLKSIEYAKRVTSDEEFDKIRDELKAACLISKPEPAPNPAETTPATADSNSAQPEVAKEKPPEETKAGEEHKHHFGIHKDKHDEKEADKPKEKVAA